MCVHSYDIIQAWVSMWFCFIWKHMNSGPNDPINHYSEMQTKKYLSTADPTSGTMDTSHKPLSCRSCFLGLSYTWENGHESWMFAQRNVFPQKCLSHRPRHGLWTSHNNHNTFPGKHLLHGSRHGSQSSYINQEFFLNKHLLHGSRHMSHYTTTNNLILHRTRREYNLGYTGGVTKGDMKTCHFTPQFLNNRGEKWH